MPNQPSTFFLSVNGHHLMWFHPKQLSRKTRFKTSPKMSGNASYMERVIWNGNGYGWEFIEPNTAPFYFSFEEIDHPRWESWLSNWRLAIPIGVTYILVIFGLQGWMKNRPAYELKEPLFWWNLSLGIFSILGFVRTLPGLLHVLRSASSFGFYQSICLRKAADIPFWFWIKIISKVVELGDTLFIVLRKRKLVFLQYFHHVATMTVAWITLPMAEPAGRWYTVLNFGVHSLMYPYFAMKGRGMHVPVQVANLITTLQFSQMIVGLGVNVLSMHYYHAGYDCARHPVSIKLFGALYGSFVLLFGKLFYDSVINRGRYSKGKLETKKVN